MRRACSAGAVWLALLGTSATAAARDAAVPFDITELDPLDGEQSEGADESRDPTGAVADEPASVATPHSTETIVEGETDVRVEAPAGAQSAEKPPRQRLRDYEKKPTDYDFKATVGPFFGHFTGGYGNWWGLHGRFWLLDVTGLRRWSGYIETVNLRWRPDRDADPLGLGDVDSDFASLRVLRYWSDSFYTFATLGTTLGDPVFPRVQAEIELDYIVPQHDGLGLSFGGGYRQYEPADRPFVLLGGSYSLPRAAVLYRLYASAHIARQPSYTHLLSFVYGERLSMWVRADFLWGDESHPDAVVPYLRNVSQDLEVDSRALNVTTEIWLKKWLGIATRVGITDARVEGDTERRFRRYEGELRPFATF